MGDNSKFHGVSDEIRNMAEIEHREGQGGSG